jgi:hypothetical protein
MITRVSCVRASHTRICESNADDATVAPSGEAASETTPKEWPVPERTKREGKRW